MERRTKKMNNLVSMYIAAELWIKDKLNNAFRKEDGAVDIIAIVILIAIAVALAIIFRKQLKTLFDTLWATISGNAVDSVSEYPE